MQRALFEGDRRRQSECRGYERSEPDAGDDLSRLQVGNG
jgi:hypothetical protein